MSTVDFIRLISSSAREIVRVGCVYRQKCNNSSPYYIYFINSLIYIIIFVILPYNVDIWWGCIDRKIGIYKHKYRMLKTSKFNSKILVKFWQIFIVLKRITKCNIPHLFSFNSHTTNINYFFSILIFTHGMLSTLRIHI